MRYLFCLLILFLANRAQSQLVQGKAVDEVTGNGIPFVSVGVVGTTNATVSNENGEFILKVTTFPVTIRVSHVSYLMAEVSLSNHQEKLNIKLKPASISLNEVTIDPFKGTKLLRAALEKAKAFAGINLYGKAFYRQLTSVDNKPNQIYELFYDLQWNPRRVQGWSAKQSRFAELGGDVSFSLNNQSYLTFLYSGYLFPEKGGKFVNLNTLASYQIVIDKYIEQADQKIAVITCKFKESRKNAYYVNSTFYIGVDDLKVYRLENSVFNLPMKFTSATPKYPAVVSTVATFNGNDHPIGVLESVSTKLNISLNARAREINGSTSSLLTVYQLDDDLKNQQFVALDRKIQDKSVVESIKYDAAFWKNNPIVKQTALEDSFIKMMESKSAFGTMTNP